MNGAQMESVMPMASKVDRWIRNVGSWISAAENWIVYSGFLQQVIYWVTVADDVTVSIKVETAAYWLFYTT